MSDDEVKAQLQIAVQGLGFAVVRLLRDGRVHPHLVLSALAKVTGEVGAGSAMASGEGLEELLDALAETMRQAGREFHAMLKAGPLPPPGHA